MANQLGMATINAILTLHKTGHSNRRIAELLGVDRETVGRYVAQSRLENQPNAPPGSDDPDRHQEPLAEATNTSDKPNVHPTVHLSVLTRPSVAGPNAPHDK